ncbi:MAG: glycine--tRNA ligase [Candidatus Diapherotrites archaeon]|nr:glycine--tRNA ligase [Candidatus Diapherotrites archaeon]
MPKEDLVNLALRRSLFYSAAEIYAGSPSGFWEFGPVGEKIRRKIIDLWRKELVEREGFLEIFGAQILPEAVFKASGHLASFADPIVQCKKCNATHRADQLIAEKTNGIVPESMSTEELAKLIKQHDVQCPKCKGKDFTEVRKFNMMMKVDIGATGQQPCYLRPETCQSIFLDFPRLFKTMRVQLPLGIAQSGSSFRNEIAPRNTLLRAREFGQMEIEVFFNPKKINEVPRFSEVENYKLNLQTLKDKSPRAMNCKEAVEKKIISAKLIAYYLARAQQCWHAFGIPIEKMRFRQLADDEKAFYSRESWDFEVETELGWVELIACNYRTDYDLAGHAKESKQDLKVKEEGCEEAFIPHVFELSAGIDRTLFVALSLALKTEKRGPEERTFMELPPRIAPYLVGVFPLMKKDGMLEKAQEIEEELVSYGLDVFFDEVGSIGKRYARVDEVGVPFAVTVDYDTMKDGTVTLRERDSMEQKRVKAAELPLLLWKLQNNKIKFKDI